MKLESEQSLPSITSEDLKEKAFGILANNKMFGILSSKIYTDKIMAPIRELSCNAFDANTEANSDEPIHVHLPTYDEPWFSVEDSGNGMDSHEIEDLYTTYGYSSKTASNKFVGCLGLGSKSPFAYTDRFSIVSRKCGVEYSYQCMIENAMPKLIKFNEEKTDLPSGTKIEFPVSFSDIYSFTGKCSNFYSNFNPKPVFSSHIDLTDPFNFNNFNIFISDDLHSRYVLMGNVLYEYNISNFDAESEEDELCEFKSIFRNINTVLKCEIGDIDIAVSREFVEMTERSKRFIAKAHLEYVKKVKEEFEEGCDDENVINRAKKIYALSKNNAFIPRADVEQKIESCSIPIEQDLSICMVYKDEYGSWYRRKTIVERTEKAFKNFFRFNQIMVSGDLEFVYEKYDKIIISGKMEDWVKQRSKSCLVVFNNLNFKEKLESLGIKVLSKEDFGKAKKKDVIQKDLDYNGIYLCERYHHCEKICGMFFRPISSYNKEEVEESKFQKIYYVKIFNKSIKVSEAERLFENTGVCSPMQLINPIPEKCQLIGVNSSAYEQIKDNPKYENYIDYLIDKFSKDSNEFKEVKRRKNKRWFEEKFNSIIGVKFQSGILPEELESILLSLDNRIDYDPASDMMSNFTSVVLPDNEKCSKIKDLLCERYGLLHTLSKISQYNRSSDDISAIQEYINLCDKQ